MRSSNESHTFAHIVIVGGGFAGLSAVKAMRDTNVDITLIDRHIYNTFQPLLYQVATAALNPGDITWFLRTVRHKQGNVRFLNATVTSMDHSAKVVSLADGKSVPYDYLVIAAGVTANFFGIPGAAEHAMPLYTRSQALTIRDEMFSRLEEAAVNGQDRDLHVIVVGGGATGVETAGALAELRNTDLPVTYPELDPRRTHITLLEMLPVLLKPFDERLQQYAVEALTKRGVDVRAGTAVKEVHPDGITDSDGNFLPAGMVVWASGITVHDSVSTWDVPQGKGGRIIIDDHLRVDGLDSVFAVGDIAAPESSALPQLAQPAIQGGRYAAKTIEAALSGEDVEAFRYRDKGTMATIGRSAAVVQVNGLPPIKGFLAWTMSMGVHLFYLLGIRNRVATIVNLGSRYLFSHRGHNAIVGETRVSAKTDD